MEQRCTSMLLAMQYRLHDKDRQRTSIMLNYVHVLEYTTLLKAVSFDSVGAADRKRRFQFCMWSVLPPPIL